MIIDPRDQQLATQLLEYSVQAKTGDTLYLEVKGIEALSLGKALIAEATKRGVSPFWFYNDESLQRQFLLHATADQIRRQAELHGELMKQADVYIGVRGSDNPFDLADIPKDTKEQFNQLFYHPVHFEERVKRTRWVVLRYPNNGMAALAERSREEFADFYYRVCLLNYKKMQEGLGLLQSKMEATNRVRIVAPDTDLRFSIEGIPALACDGKYNIPDGEVFTAPV
ncbi:MAG: aminopeptidase, partial [Bdellovibrionales bacterium]|nr:aminopeptidase [Bdellovibrionales bacterium]